MKKFSYIIALFLLIIGIECYADGKEPILKYGNYSVQDVRSFATGKTTKKSLQFTKKILSLVNRKLEEQGFQKRFYDIGEVFDNVIEQEIRLTPRHWRNSSWNPSNEDVDWDNELSEAGYEGFAGIFVYEENGKHLSFPIYKKTCANLVDVDITITPINTEHQVLVPDSLIPVYGSPRVDTVYKIMWIQAPTQTIQCEVVCSSCQGQNQEPYYNISYTPWMGWFQPSCGYGGSNYYSPSISSVNINNYSKNITNINNYNTNNTSNNNYTYTRPGSRYTPPDNTNTGGSRYTPSENTNINRSEKSSISNNTRSSEYMGNAKSTVDNTIIRSDGRSQASRAKSNNLTGYNASSKNAFATPKTRSNNPESTTRGYSNQSPTRSNNPESTTRGYSNQSPTRSGNATPQKVGSRSSGRGGGRR